MIARSHSSHPLHSSHPQGRSPSGAPFRFLASVTKMNGKMVYREAGIYNMKDNLPSNLRVPANVYEKL